MTADPTWADRRRAAAARADRVATLRGATPDDRFALATRWTLVHLGIPFRVWLDGRAFPTVADRQRFDALRDARLLWNAMLGRGRATHYDAQCREGFRLRLKDGRRYRRADHDTTTTQRREAA